MKIELDLTEHQFDILQQFRKLYAEHQGTPASASTLKPQQWRQKRSDLSSSASSRSLAVRSCAGGGRASLDSPSKRRGYFFQKCSAMKDFGITIVMVFYSL
jgi:hypothetical protein